MVGLPYAVAECGGAECLVSEKSRHVLLLIFCAWVLSNVYICGTEDKNCL